MVEILYHEELLYLSSQILIHGDVMLAWNQPQEYLESGKCYKSGLGWVLMLKEFSVMK